VGRSTHPPPEHGGPGEVAAVGAVRHAGCAAGAHEPRQGGDDPVLRGHRARPPHGDGPHPRDTQTRSKRKGIDRTGQQGLKSIRPSGG